jgi:DNA-binding transcriptional regulator YhcF (GntR family)
MNVTLETQTNLVPKPTQADWESWLGNWIWRAVQCLVELPEFNPSPKWIATRLNISVENAVEAIESLERLGCIKKANSTFMIVSEWQQLTPSELTNDRLLNAQSRIAPQLISKLTPFDAFTSQFMIGDKEIIRKYSTKFMKLFKEMNDEAKTGKCNEVIAAQISFVQLSGSQEEGAQ